MDPMPLSFETLVAYLNRAIGQIQDPQHGTAQIPSDPQLRNVLDQVSEMAFISMFTWVYKRLHQSGFLQSHAVLDHELLVRLDGTQYFSSHQIHCAECRHKTHSNGSVSYFHQAILPAIVAPVKSEVLVLAPEFITPQDGQEKQDCEINAAKHWIDFTHQPLGGKPSRC